MQVNFLPLDLYTAHLTTIEDIIFTRREIEIMAFLISGRSVKGIASNLHIASKTAEAHIHNIMRKLDCNSREHIISFIEKSDKISLMREHYSNLLISYSFDQILIEISKLNSSTPSSCLIIGWKENGETSPLAHQIEIHLKKAGFVVRLEIRENPQSLLLLISETHSNDAIIYCLPKISPQPIIDIIDSCPANVIFVLSESPPNELPTKLPINYIDLLKQKNYYFMIFEILQSLCPKLDFDKINTNFKKGIEGVSIAHSQHVSPLLEPETMVLPPEEDRRKEDIEPLKSHLFLLLSKKPKWVLGGVSILACLGLVIIFLLGINQYFSRQSPEAQFLGSDLATPTLLSRNNLIQQLDNKLKGTDDIKTIALIGMGGAGKTTLARQYAHSQNASIIWEINAETKEKLLHSLQALAYALSKTGEEKKILDSLKDIRNFEEREEKIIQLVKGQLKTQPNWLLIYDDVEKFSDIQKYFPSDANSWGKGKVLITTQDTHIKSNSFIKDILWVGELDESEKLALFMKIMNHGEKAIDNSTQQELTRKFLAQIPSFPLDISVAAYYMKATNVDPNRYAKYLVIYNHEFSDIQKNILNESSSYTKTRYHIITLSLDKLITVDKDFAVLLLLISLLDSRNIPKDLLDSYKGKIIVDKFIYHLKKYSLITSSLSDSPSPLALLSIHNSTQDIILAYLSEFLKLSKDSQLLKTMINNLDDYIDKVIEQEDFEKMQMMAQHLKKVLNHPNLLADFPKALLESKLGVIYYFINSDGYDRLLDNSLKMLTAEHVSSEENVKAARSLLHIGAVYTELRLDKRAEDLFEKVINIYGEKGLKNYRELSWALAHLGNLHRRLKDYASAQDYFEKSIQLHKQYGTDKKRLARTLAHLGGVYRGRGFYQKAIDSLEESLVLYEKNFQNDHFRIGWILTQLGNAHRELGDLEKAKKYLEAGLRIFQTHLPGNHVDKGLVLAYLGNYFREQGKVEKSRDYLEQSLKIYTKYFDENHTRMGWVLFHLGKTYKVIGNEKEAQKLFDRVLKIYAEHCGEETVGTALLFRGMAEISMGRNRLNDAENFIKRSLKIYKDHNHVEAYSALEILGEIYLKQSNQSSEGDSLKTQALEAFNQALMITEQNFPKNSVHIERIREKIKKGQGYGD